LGGGALRTDIEISIEQGRQDSATAPCVISLLREPNPY
jgi:hypothetical protein